MKIHWRTADRWLKERERGASIFYIARQYGLTATNMGPQTACAIVEDAIRRAILRRERKRKHKVL